MYVSPYIFVHPLYLTSCKQKVIERHLDFFFFSRISVWYVPEVLYERTLCGVLSCYSPSVHGQDYLGSQRLFWFLGIFSSCTWLWSYMITNGIYSLTEALNMRYLSLMLCPRRAVTNQAFLWLTPLSLKGWSQLFWNLLKNGLGATQEWWEHNASLLCWVGGGLGVVGGPDLTVGAVWGGHGQEVMASPWSVVYAEGEVFLFSSFPFSWLQSCMSHPSKHSDLPKLRCMLYTFFQYPSGTQTHPGFHFAFAWSSYARTAALSFWVLIHFYWTDT